MMLNTCRIMLCFRRVGAIVWESIWQSRPLNFQDNQPSKPILILRPYHIAAAESEVHFLQTGLCVDGDRRQYGITYMLDHVFSAGLGTKSLPGVSAVRNKLGPGL